MTAAALDHTSRPLDQFSVRVADEGTTTVVSLRGEADVFTLPAVVDALASVFSDHDGPVVVDLAETSFIDLCTMRAVGRAARFLAYRGRALTVRAPSRMALYLLAFLGLSDLIQVGLPQHERRPGAHLAKR